MRVGAKIVEALIRKVELAEKHRALTKLERVAVVLGSLAPWAARRAAETIPSEEDVREVEEIIGDRLELDRDEVYLLAGVKKYVETVVARNGIQELYRMFPGAGAWQGSRRPMPQPG